MWESIFHYAYLQNALISAILTSVVCGTIGTIVLEKRMLMLTGGIAHVAFGGIGLGYLAGFPPFIGAALFSVGSSLGIGRLSRNAKRNADILVGLVWSMGMALGVLFISFMDGYPPDLTSYLFGNILTVPSYEVKAMIVITVLVVSVILVLFHAYKIYLFDEDFAKVQGVKVNVLEYVLFILLGLAIVVLIQVVGFVLIFALITSPPATAKFFTKNLGVMMAVSVGICLLFTIGGLWLSYSFNIPSGATIIVLSGCCYFCVYFFNKVLLSRKAA
ncbi:metal ABC transporter permease [Halobacillus salinarum]|uniref:Metal ABC transporter permease n=1 Tax=Halobacillus salinarum TaxID=2932257 RepID=A0ABY4EIQ3_9BACI|nr:metal ABC transporter permease [Halobacillus salinarum]UOQ44310.1 metal ABC transporter permease [Halobacillus salinarum]